ncbi:MAG: hypothetical protein E7J78_02975 [Pantoea sp.]|nr:hypothetical protein [Pantoea sp.]
MANDPIRQLYRRPAQFWQDVSCQVGAIHFHLAFTMLPAGA